MYFILVTFYGTKKRSMGFIIYRMEEVCEMCSSLIILGGFQMTSLSLMQPFSNRHGKNRSPLQKSAAFKMKIMKLTLTTY